MSPLLRVTSTAMRGGEGNGCRVERLEIKTQSESDEQQTACEKKIRIIWREIKKWER